MTTRTVLMAASGLVMGLGLLSVEFMDAQDIARLQSGVVKIIAKPPDGTTNIGTGFIVRLETNAAYIVTSAHVVAGDAQPKVEFFTKRNLPVRAEVLGLEGDDEVRGLALLVVRGAENLPTGLTALPLAGTARLSGGEDILVIGFPRNAGPWALIKGNISSRQGRDIYFSPSVDSGHSGGPVFQGGKVVAVVGAGSQSVGRGVTVRSVQDYIEGFGITVQESTSTASTVPAPSPPPVETAKLEPRQIPQDREITGKDGAPMVLIPAGEFWMGSPDNEGNEDEHPVHRVYLDAYYIDKFEVTVGRYAVFLRSTDQARPMFGDQVDSNKDDSLPIVGVYWNDAEYYCRWAGKRLPTEAEWEKAARGTDERRYPWGNERPTTSRTTIFGLPLARVDSYAVGKSPYGLYHMAGNVLEWVADWYDESYYATSPEHNPKGPSSGQFHLARGGAWAFEETYFRSAARFPVYRPSKRLDASIGFRCAKDAPK